MSDVAKIEQEIERPTKRPRWAQIVVAFATTALIFYGPQIIAAVLLSFGVVFSGATEAQINDWLNSTTGNFIVGFVTYGLMPVIMWLFIRRWRESWQQYGVRKSPIMQVLAYATSGFFVYYVALVALMILVGALGVIDLTQEQEIGFSRETSGAWLVLVYIGLVVLPATVEELLFRGFLFTRLRRVLSFAWTTVLVSIIFGALHLQLGAGAPPLWSVMLDTIVLSVVLCYLREKTGSIWAGVLVHGAKNTIAFVALFLL